MINLHWVILLPIIFGTVAKLISIKTVKKIAVLFQASLLVCVAMFFVIVRVFGTFID